MRGLSQILCLLSVTSLGYSLECYNCDSESNKECTEIKKGGSIKPVECRPNVIGQNNHGWFKDITKIDFFETDPNVIVPMVCQKIVAKNGKSEIHTFRGCQVTGGKTPVCDITRSKADSMTHDKIEIVACETCVEDNCNKSSQLYIKSGILLLALAILRAMV